MIIVLNLNQINAEQQSDEFHLVFEEVGLMASSANYLLSKMSINLTVLEEMVIRFQNIIQLQIDAVNDVVADDPKDEPQIRPYKERLVLNLRIHREDANDLLIRVHRLRDTLPTPEEHTKVGGDHLVEKRFVLSLLFGALGTYMGTLTDKKYERLQESLTTTNEVQKKLIEVVNNQERDIHNISSNLLKFKTELDTLAILNPANLETSFRSTGARIKNEIDRIHNVLQIAQWRRLALDFLSTTQLHNLFTTLSKTSQRSHLELLISKPSDLLQLELSYFFDGTVVTLLLHVPVVPAGSLLRLIKLHPFPLPISGNYSIVPDVDSQILALSTSETIMSSQFPATNLLGCNQVSHVYLCDKQGILDKRLEQSCLGALYNQKFDVARTLCPMKIINAEEIIYRLNNNRHLVYTPTGQTIPINCPGRSSEKFLQRGVSEFQLDPGCKTSLQHHYVFADESIAMDSGLEHITLPRDSQMGIPHISSEDLEQHLQAMKGHGQYRPTVNDLIEAHEQSKDLNSKTSLIWSYVVWTFLFLCIIIIITCICFLYSQFRYLHNTFLTALQIKSRKLLREFFQTFFIKHTQNLQLEV